MMNCHLMQLLGDGPGEWDERNQCGGVERQYENEGQMLKLQYFGHLMRRADSLEKTLMLGGIGGRRRRGRQRMRWLDDITVLMDVNLSELWEIGRASCRERV